MSAVPASAGTARWRGRTYDIEQLIRLDHRPATCVRVAGRLLSRLTRALEGWGVGGVRDRTPCRGHDRCGTLWTARWHGRRRGDASTASDG